MTAKTKAKIQRFFPFGKLRPWRNGGSVRGRRSRGWAMSSTTLRHSQPGASRFLERFRSSSAIQLLRVAASIWRAWALPTTPARKLAAATASSRVSRSISSLRSCGISSRRMTGRSRSFVASMRRRERGEIAGAGDDALGEVFGHGGVLGWPGGGCCGADGFLDVDEAELVVFLGADSEEHGVAEAAERAAALHPIRGVEDADLSVVVAMLERGDELADGFGVEELLDLGLLFFERPRSVLPSGILGFTSSMRSWAR